MIGYEREATDKSLDTPLVDGMTVTLRRDDWMAIVHYLNLSAGYRKKEREGWEKLSKELDENGSPVFKTAAVNAALWAELNDRISRLLPKM